MNVIICGTRKKYRDHMTINYTLHPRSIHLCIDNYFTKLLVAFLSCLLFVLWQGKEINPKYVHLSIWFRINEVHKSHFCCIQTNCHWLLFFLFSSSLSTIVKHFKNMSLAILNYSIWSNGITFAAHHFYFIGLS